MCTDKNFHNALLRKSKSLFLLLRTAEAVQYIYVYTEIMKSFRKGLKMLLCQNRSRYKDCYLLIIGNRLECRPYSDLGLAKAYITAHQSVHRLTRFHITLYITDSHKLVTGFLIRKGFLKFLLHKIILGKSIAHRLFSSGIKSNQLLCNILHSLFCLGNLLLPLSTRHFMQFWHLSLRTDIFL